MCGLSRCLDRSAVCLARDTQDQEHEKRQKLEKELKAVDAWAAAASGEGEACGWLCGEAGEGCMTLADIAYFPFLERIDATLEPFKVGVVTCRSGIVVHIGTGSVMM